MTKRTTRGTPFITNIAKEVFENKKKAEEKSDQSKKPTIPSNKLPEQTVPYGYYNTNVPTIQFPGTSQKFSPASFQHLLAPNTAISYGPNLRMPIQQVYNINLPGPTGGHVEMNKIYENILPGKEASLTASTLGERLQLWDYIRQILIRVNEGEEISIDSSGQNSLLSYIKLMELNPTYYNPLDDNPYHGLPYGLLIYRSCFPIRLEKTSQSVICAKNSIGLNIRLYALNYAEYCTYLFQQSTYKEYDVWRELAYYEYIREYIIKKKVSPNFPLLYAFFLSPNRKIDFFSLKRQCLTQKDMLTKQYQEFVKIHTLFSMIQPSNEIIRPMTMVTSAKKIITKLPDETDPLLQAYSGTTLILVTEAPNNNIYQWASRIYEKDGIVRKMISHGYHNAAVWHGILFQIVSALYVLQIHGIYIRDMTMKDNVYIKDLQTRGKATGYWKYVIDGIPYYIPNNGYLVMIDTNFKDIIPQGHTIERCKREYKIYTSNIFGKCYPMKDIRKKVFENYRTIVNTNSFTKEYTQNNVNRPPESIMKLIEAMMLDPETDLGKVLSKYFRSFMNNRIGTLLIKETEIPHIRDVTRRFNVGEMAVEVINEDLFKWCLIEQYQDNDIVTIITREKPSDENFISKDVRIETLKLYATPETISQYILGDINYSEDNLLETYFMTK